MNLNDIHDELRHSPWWNGDSRPRFAIHHKIMDESKISKIIFFDTPVNGREMVLSQNIFGNYELKYTSGYQHIDITIFGNPNISAHHIAKQIIDFLKLLIN